VALRWPILAAAATLHAVLVLLPAWLLAWWRGEAPRLSLACCGLLLLASGWGALEARWTSATRDAGAAGRAPALQGALLWLAMVCAASTLLVGPGDCLGGSLVCTGIGLRLAAIASLGGQFRTRLEGAPDQTLITTGLYGWIRHPSELGNVCIMLGLAALAHAGPFALLVTAAALVLANHRVREEDAALLRGHGSRFTAHAAAVGAWTPLRAFGSRLRRRGFGGA
jgi:protein-S-isoprenylcysteine O-methyltransferase Ste14